MNISSTNNLRPCTSCQVCGALCPVDAISIQMNREGFYRPIVDESKCIACGQCVKICYKYDDDIKMTADKELLYKPLFSAYATDDDVLKHSTSGGIGNLLAHQLFKDGYKVVGVVYNEQKVRCEHQIATTNADLNNFRGSKYIQSYTYEAVKDILKNVSTEKYAFFGTPCQIYALHRLIDKKRKSDNFLFIDFYCHGCPSHHLWTKYETYIKRKLNLSHFQNVDFRSKVKGWGNFVIVANSNNKPVFVSNPAENGFYELFFSNSVLNDSCANCLLRSTLEYTDIRMGDFWGKKYLDNSKGVSAVSVVTDKGMNLFKKIQPYIISSQCDYRDFLPYQSWNISYKTDVIQRNKLLDVLANPNSSIQDVVQICRSYQTFVERLKRYARSILYYLPFGVTAAIKRIL